MKYEQVVCHLLDAGEFDSAELLLQESAVLDEVGADVLRELEGKIERARGEAVESVRGTLADIQVRGVAHGFDVDVDAVVEAARGRRADAEALIVEARLRVETADTKLVTDLRERLESIPRGDVPESLFIEWTAEIRHAISLGAVDASRAAIEAGPSTDRPVLVGVPSPPVWPYRTEPLRVLLDWMFGEGVVPPGFERYRPEATDQEAWGLLAAFRSRNWHADPSLISRLAGVLGCTAKAVRVFDEGVLGRLDDLSAPGFHAFGCRASPEGVLVWIPASDVHARPGAVGQELVIEVATGREAGVATQTLRLDLHDVLAVIRDRSNRRSRLLAQLGRQLPLERAFIDPRADESVRWERSDIPPDLLSGDRPVLLVGAPGMGKSTLLLELARGSARTAEVVRARNGTDLPQAEVILVDEVDQLGPEALRGLVRDIHWVRTTRSPTPTVLVAIRPDSLSKFDDLSKGMFQLRDLPPRSLGSLREQARTMLGWIGVEATTPSSYDRLAFLAAGNPTVLFFLCRALTQTLLSEGRARRRFTPHHLEVAWESREFRSQVRELLWAPLRVVDGAAETLQVLVDFCDPGNVLATNDAAWAINETVGTRTEVWIEERLSLLERYGLIRRAQGGIRMVLGGPGLMLRTWLDADQQATDLRTGPAGGT